VKTLKFLWKKLKESRAWQEVFLLCYLSSYALSAKTFRVLPFVVCLVAGSMLVALIFSLTHHDKRHVANSPSR